MDWYIGPKVRCDLVGYGGANLTGPRYVVRVFATGTRKGTFRTAELKSMVVLAPVGTRVFLTTSAAKDGWWSRPWRCIRMIEGNMFTNPEGQRGVRVPDLDWMDSWEAKRSNADFQQGFPQVKHPSEGTGYTFGFSGDPLLKGHIQAIWIEREVDPIALTGGPSGGADQEGPGEAGEEAE